MKAIPLTFLTLVLAAAGVTPALAHGGHADGKSAVIAVHYKHRDRDHDDRHWRRDDRKHHGHNYRHDRDRKWRHRSHHESRHYYIPWFVFDYGYGHHRW
ncbi:MAG: hypothetical protein KDG50_11840 [Chromatiales bacterium]|nr:hypothetical protein [Chromatiales bacterium]